MFHHLVTTDDTPQVKAIKLEKLVSSFQTLGSSLAVTQGTFEKTYPCELGDLDWNHMDQLHRPCIHRTYQKSLRVALGRDFATSLTTVRLGPIPFLVLVSDIRIHAGLFYQSYSFFNIFYVHTVLQHTPKGEVYHKRIDWYIVSHPLFKFLHPYLNRRIQRLQDVQNEEDLPVLLRRAELRAKGYHFGTDEPDYISSNTLTDKVHFPSAGGVHRFSLEGIPPGPELRKLSAGPVDFLLGRERDGVTVWPAVCPHEGGLLEACRVCNGQIECPWHQLKFSGVRLSSHQSQGRLGDFQLTWEINELIVEQAS